MKSPERLIHVAVKSANGYFHHYIIEKIWNILKKCSVVHYSGDLSVFASGKTAGEILREEKSFDSLTNEIKDGTLYTFQRDNYPNTNYKYTQAVTRMEKRVGERFYHALFNNCEHLANYIMTGVSHSEQVIKMTTMGKFAGIMAEYFVCSLKENALMSLIDSIPAAIVAHKTIQEGIMEVIKASKRLHGPMRAVAEEARRFLISSKSSVVINASKKSVAAATLTRSSEICRSGRNICEAASKTKGCKVNLSKLVRNKQCAKVADKVGKDSMKQTAKSAAISALVVEGCFAGYNIYQMYQKCNRNEMSERDFQTESTKTVLAAGASVACSTAFSVVGQVVIPVPGVGALVGSSVGSFTGRWVASTVATLAGY